MVGRFGLTRGTARPLLPFLSSSSPACQSCTCTMSGRRPRSRSRFTMTSSSPPFGHFANPLCGMCGHWVPDGNLMQPRRFAPSGPQPRTRNQLIVWVREHCPLSSHLEAELLDAIEAVFTRHEKLWEESKREAIQALSRG